MTIKKHSFALVLILSYSIFSSAEASDISLLIKECNEGMANSCGQAGVYYENSENADLKKLNKCIQQVATLMICFLVEL